MPDGRDRYIPTQAPLGSPVPHGWSPGLNTPIPTTFLPPMAPIMPQPARPEKVAMDPLSEGVSSIGKGISSVGSGLQEGISASVDGVKSAVDSGVDALEHTALGSTAIGTGILELGKFATHLVGGAVKGVTSVATGAVSLAGTAISYVSDENTRRDVNQKVGDAVSTFAHDPLGTTGKVVGAAVEAFEKDPGDFLGQAGAMLVPGLGAAGALGKVGEGVAVGARVASETAATGARVVATGARKGMEVGGRVLSEGVETGTRLAGDGVQFGTRVFNDGVRMAREAAPGLETAVGDAGRRATEWGGKVVDRSKEIGSDLWERGNQAWDRLRTNPGATPEPVGPIILRPEPRTPLLEGPKTLSTPEPQLLLEGPKPQLLLEGPKPAAEVAVPPTATPELQVSIANEPPSGPILEALPAETPGLQVSVAGETPTGPILEALPAETPGLQVSVASETPTGPILEALPADAPLVGARPADVLVQAEREGATVQPHGDDLAQPHSYDDADHYGVFGE